jgi:hypothetical protein
MPLSSSQLAALVDRARIKAPPAVSPPPRPVQPLPAASARPTPAPARPLPTASVKSMPKQRAAASSPAASAEVSCEPTLSVPAIPAPAPELDAFPEGWELRKESWRFHRRFFAVFRRPMERGEYSHLLWQIRRGAAEHLGADCWRVTLPSGRTLPVRGSVWNLITILPKGWQPPIEPAP